jgi:ribosomal protein S10
MEQNNSFAELSSTKRASIDKFARAAVAAAAAEACRWDGRRPEPTLPAKFTATGDEPESTCRSAELERVRWL